MSALPCDGADARHQPRPPRPRPKPRRKSRCLAILEPASPETGGWFAVRVTEGRKADVYLVLPIASDIGGEAFQVEKLDADLNTIVTYHVRIGEPRECSCECRGFVQYTHCRHVEGLLALDARGQLPRKQKHAACPQCLEPCDGGQLCERCAAEEAEFAAYHQRLEMDAGRQNGTAQPSDL